MNEKIYYNEDLPEGVEPLYNGNIADVYYSAHDSAHFRLSYDGLNRLTASQQYTRDGVKTAAAEAFTYDKMGNITSIVRSTQNPQPDYINRVQLFYDGNRIIRGEGSPYSGGYNDMVYPNLVGKDVEYEYDPNGNLIKNEDNRISLTTYNLLNLPQTVAFSDKSLSVFYYMADGRKIRNATGAYSISTAVPIDSVIKNTDPYISYMSEWNDVYWYQRTQQKYINTPEGNIEVSTGRKMSFSYYYTSKDHLGSIWHYWNSLNNSRANIYYPSGIMREKRRSPYNYGLTGKEIVYDNGLDEYFFGARTLFAPINRFNQPDPLCEEYYHISPYAYCANNFINAVDPDGRDWYEANNGKIIWTNYTSQKDLDDNKIEGKYLGQAHVVFSGSRDERLGKKNGKNGYIDGEVAITANVTLYGPRGADDITTMTGFTMTSNVNKYGAIAEGLFNANYDVNGKSGTLKSNWVLNHRKEIPTMDNKPNQSPYAGENYGKPIKTGIFIHSTNSSGYAGGTVSTGCLLLAPQDFQNFNKIMSGVRNFTVRLTREQTTIVPFPLAVFIGHEPFIRLTTIRR